ncbi:MAG: LPS assembly lipoprotein LptE [Pseudomonadota bacterium]
MSLSEARSQKSEVRSQKLKIFFWILVSGFWIPASGCGFEPMHAAGTSVMPDAGIEISNIPDRDGQYLRNQLIDRLDAAGRPADAPYQLRFSTLSKTVVNLGIEKTATATRAQMQIATQMQLVERRTGKVLLQRPLRATGAYNLLDNQLATLTSQQNTTENLLQEISDDAVTELSLYFRRKALRLL